MINIDLHKTFVAHGKEVKLQLDTQITQGKINVVYGKSGVGKSSLLRMLAGLMDPDKGKITVGNETWYDSSNKINLRANKRSIGFLFQDYSLFPNMNILKNIKYGLENNDDQSLVERIIETADLKDLLYRKPDSLSGGQQQRVALARAIVRRPKLLLLDEPLSALDSEMRVKLQHEILDLQKIVNTTIIVVSHDLPEVFKLADEVLLMENGIFTKRGTPSEVFLESTSSKPDTFAEILSINDDKTKLTLKIDGKVVGIEINKSLFSS